ncbi:N-lysine methyltransferase METTL21A-like protein [Drosera capensis]
MRNDQERMGRGSSRFHQLSTGVETKQGKTTQLLQSSRSPIMGDRSSSISDSPCSDLLDFRSKRGIEIGSGCGVAGMGLSLLVLTDIDAVMPALKHNLKWNKHVLKRPPFDVVIAADVVYLEETVADLVETMEMLVKENGVVLLGCQVRPVVADRLFWERCGRVFGVVEKVKNEDLDSEYRFEETDVFVVRKKSKFWCSYFENIETQKATYPALGKVPILS